VKGNCGANDSQPDFERRRASKDLERGSSSTRPVYPVGGKFTRWVPLQFRLSVFPVKLAGVAAMDRAAGTAVARERGRANLLTEQAMNTIIDLNSELLIDRSTIRNPYLRLLLTAMGEELVRGSPWVAVSKKIAYQDRLTSQFLDLKNWHAVAMSA
jgi:hypothetical protein